MTCGAAAGPSGTAQWQEKQLGGTASNPLTILLLPDAAGNYSIRNVPRDALVALLEHAILLAEGACEPDELRTYHASASLLEASA